MEVSIEYEVVVKCEKCGHKQTVCGVAEDDICPPDPDGPDL